MSKVFKRDFLIMVECFTFYFFTWAITFAFLPIWLKDNAHLNEVQSGLIFSGISLAALCYHPFFGYIQDKLGYKKNLFAIIAGAMIFLVYFLTGYLFLCLNIIFGLVYLFVVFI